LAITRSLTEPPQHPPALERLSTEATEAVASDASFTLLGKWEQWMYNPVEKAWFSGGIYRVTIRQQRLAMSIINNSDVDPEVINSQGLINLKYADGLWSFQSQLETGELLDFRLLCVDADTFSGHCYRDGVAGLANTWQRVK
jgi:hypothetical protein